MYIPSASAAAMAAGLDYLARHTDELMEEALAYEERRAADRAKVAKVISDYRAARYAVEAALKRGAGKAIIRGVYLPVYQRRLDDLYRAAQDGRMGRSLVGVRTNWPRLRAYAAALHQEVANLPN